MVEFEPVKVEDIGTIEQCRKGRISWPILKMFIESEIYVAKLNRKTVENCKNPSAAHMNMLLRSYLARHPEVPVDVIMSNKEIYLKRVDIDKDGKSIENWRKRQEETIIGEPAELKTEDIDSHQ